MSDSTQRTWATFLHLSALSKFVGVPFGNLLGPIVLWLLKKDDSPFVDDHGKEAINFQLSLTLYFMVGVVAVLGFFITDGMTAVLFAHNPVVLLMAIMSTALVPFLFLAALLCLDVFVVVTAAIKASAGQLYHYPLCVHFLK